MYKVGYEFESIFCGLIYSISKKNLGLQIKNNGFLGNKKA